ncbi:MAG: hypothetical protein KKC46_02030 [Proteobacteria bacterium]|nr:hypothetical protein [Pseudomonadota bacterium]
MGFSGDSTLKEVLENEEGKAILEKHIPGSTTNPMLKMGYTMSLDLIASLPQAGISKEAYKAILDDLSKL